MDVGWIQQLHQSALGQQLPPCLLVYGAVRLRVGSVHQRSGLHGRLLPHEGHPRLEPFPHRVLHAEPHRRHRARLHLVDDLRRHPLALRHVDPAQHEARLLGSHHPDVLAADRLHDDHLHRGPASRARGHARGREDRRREPLADALESHDPECDALHHHLHVPLSYERLQALRPEPRPHGRPALYHPVRRQLDQRDRNARAEHSQHVLRAECQLARHRAGQGRAVLQLSANRKKEVQQ